jgi:hypothetical protein
MINKELKTKNALLLGDLVSTITKYTGIKWLTDLIVIKILGFESCGCEGRKNKLNKITISRDGIRNNE